MTKEEAKRRLVELHNRIEDREKEDAQAIRIVLSHLGVAEVKRDALKARVEELENKTSLDRLTTFLETPVEEFFPEGAEAKLDKLREIAVLDIKERVVTKQEIEAVTQTNEQVEAWDTAYDRAYADYAARVLGIVDQEETL